MMRHPILISALFLLAAVSSVFPALANDQEERVKEELSTYNDRYNVLVANYNLEAFLALYGDSPLWIAPTVEPVQGLDVPRNTFQFIIDQKGQLTHTFDEFRVSDDGSQAVMVGQYKADIESVGAHSKGTYLFVLERVNDRWKIVIDMFNEHAAP